MSSPAGTPVSQPSLAVGLSFPRRVKWIGLSIFDRNAFVFLAFAFRAGDTGGFSDHGRGAGGSQSHPLPGSGGTNDILGRSLSSLHFYDQDSFYRPPE